MAILKCKMCGGDIELSADKTVGICEYCGSTMTLPKIDDDQRAAAFNRGNHFRRAGEFDKALSVYERIVAEDDSDAEAHWCCALCRFGIEYVEDPVSLEYIPTCHRASFDSFLDDVDYLAAVEHSEGLTRRQYQKDAAKIADVQRGILATSQSAEPYDVFICYKETDDTTKQRTKDSIDAQDIFYQLTQEGYRVFFSRITLEDVAGAQYEPYIFAALNSAKVMIAVGSKPEYFNAVWVKNEWSRFLALMRKDRSKLLLPCYRDMDPYDLPEQLSVLQSYDMSKIGFMQDLIRGVKKVVDAGKEKAGKAAVKETVVVGAVNANIAPLLERAFLFLEDGKWQDANIYCEKVLDIDPKNAEAYLGKLMADLQVRTRGQLADCAEPFDGKENYGKVIRFGDEKLETEMRGYITHINERNENARLTGIYNGAVNAMNAANSEAAFKAAADTFKTIPGFKDADSLVELCLNKAEEKRKDNIYYSAKATMEKAIPLQNTNSPFFNSTSRFKAALIRYEEAIKLFSTISGWRDTDEQIYACRKKIEEIKAKEEADRLERERQAEQKRIAAEKAAKKRKKIIAIATPIVVACIAFLIVLTTVIIPNGKYNDAISLLEKGDVINAYESLIALNGYKDSAEKAKEIFGKYKIEKLKTASVGDIVYFGAYEQDNNTSNGKEDIEWLVLAKESDRILLISKYGLDCQEYNYTYDVDVTWDMCSLRSWLNGTFYRNAFGSEEQNIILSTTVKADIDPRYTDRSQGKSTNDKVFLLSVSEANKYFSSDKERQCQGTPYCMAQRVGWAKEYYDNCWYWLRTGGREMYFAVMVYSDGRIADGYNCASDYAVRPAVWVNLGS